MTQRELLSDQLSSAHAALTSKLWLIKQDKDGKWQAKDVATIGDPSKIPLPVDISITADGKGLWVNTFMDGKTRYFDMTDPESPKQTYEHATGKQVNMVSQSWDGKRVYLTSSLLANWDRKGADDEQFGVLRGVEEGLLLESNPNQMENFKNVDPRWVDVEFDPGRKYTVPWQWGSTGVSVDTAVTADEALHEGGRAVERPVTGDICETIVHLDELEVEAVARRGGQGRSRKRTVTSESP